MVIDNFRRKPTYIITHRALAAMGEPVGDPFGGPAYGEKRGPALALVGAVGSISAGMAIGASTLMGGLMIAGGVMSGLGAITGNKTLSTLGMVAGLAGGVGQFFQSGGFEAMGNAYEAGGIGGAWDQFTGNVPAGGDGTELMYGGIEPAAAVATEPVTGLIGSAAQPSVAQNIVATGELAGGAAAPAANVASGAASAASDAAKTGGSAAGDFFKSDMAKFGLIQAGGGFLKGLGESDAAEKKLAQDKEYMDTKTAQDQSLIDKKLAGVPMASIGSFGTNKDAAVFGRNADGSPATREQYINAWKNYYSTPLQQGAAQ